MPATVDAPADSAAGDVPFELAGPGGVALVVPVHVNGAGPFDFVLDTGATMSCLNRELADRLQLPDASAVGIGAGVAGSGRVQLVQVDSLRVGQAMTGDVAACALDLEHMSDIGIEIDGLLGLSFLRAFRVVLDFERNVVNLQAAGQREDR